MNKCKEQRYRPWIAGYNFVAWGKVFNGISPSVVNIMLPATMPASVEHVRVCESCLLLTRLTVFGFIGVSFFLQPAFSLTLIYDESG